MHRTAKYLSRQHFPHFDPYFPQISAVENLAVLLGDPEKIPHFPQIPHIHFRSSVPIELA